MKSKSGQVQVDFFIVGQPKSGTTALAHFLSQHDSINISVPKEPVFFATDFHEESDSYHGKQMYFHYRSTGDLLSLFQHVNSASLLGEGSTSYLYSKNAAANIHRHNPKARVIIMLRDPVDLVHSLHMQYVNETQEDEPDFEKALKLETARKRGQSLPKRISAPSYLYYSERVKYAEQVQRFLEVFPKNQVKIIVMEQFKKNNEKMLSDVLDFLGVDKDVDITVSEVHGSKAPRSHAVNKLLNIQVTKTLLHKSLGPRNYTRLRDAVANLLMKEADRIPLSPKLLTKLRAEYRDEVHKAEKLLELPLSKIWGY